MKTKENQEARRESSHTVQFDAKCKIHQLLQTSVQESLILAPTVQGVGCISYKKLITPATQPIRNHHHPELSLFLQWAFIQNDPSQLSPFSL